MLMPVELQPGLVRGETPYQVTGRWWDMNLIRWQGGHMRPIGGWTRLTESPLDGPVRRFHVWRDNSNSELILAFTDAKVYTDQAGFTDITPVGYGGTGGGSGGLSAGYGTLTYGSYEYGTERPMTTTLYQPYGFVSADNWGEDVIFTSNVDGRLFLYDASAPTAQPDVLDAGAPEGNNGVVVTEERHVMCIGSGGLGGSPRRVAWCSREDYSDWNFLSTTNTAGFQELDAKTPLLKGFKVREGVLIFSSSEVFLARYVGLPFIYGFEKIADTSLMHPDSVAVFDGKAVWLSRGGFQLYSAGTVQPLPCPFVEDILAEIDPLIGGYKLHASKNGTYPEVWFFWPEGESVGANRYAVWNYAENSWAWGELARSSMYSADVHGFPLMGDENGDVFEHENGWTDAGNTRVGDVWIESGALGIGNGDKTVEIRQLLLSGGQGYGSIAATIYGQFTPQGSERTFGPYTPRSDGYTDTRANGRGVRLRLEATQDTDWSAGKFWLDVAAGTGR